MSDWTNAGRVAPIPKGAYSGSTAYEQLDIVTYGGAVYMAKKTSTGITPGTNDECWMLLVAPTSADEQDIQDTFSYVFS